MGASLQILLATYNGERYVATQLESLLVQDFTDFEVLVSDDRSSDATLEIVQRYAEADTRIRVLDNDVRCVPMMKDCFRENNTSYVVTELVRGEALSSIIRRKSAVI